MEIDRLVDLRIANEISEEVYNHKKAQRQLELMVVEEKIKRLQNNVNYQQEQVDDLLNFVENIRDKFKMADPKEQKSICAYFGWNWLLKEKELTFTKHNWFYDVEEMSNLYEANKHRLELIKTFTEFKESPYFEEFQTILRCLNDSNLCIQ